MNNTELIFCWHFMQKYSTYIDIDLSRKTLRILRHPILLQLYSTIFSVNFFFLYLSAWSMNKTTQKNLMTKETSLWKGFFFRLTLIHHHHHLFSFFPSFLHFYFILYGHNNTNLILSILKWCVYIKLLCNSHFLH